MKSIKNLIAAAICLITVGCASVPGMRPIDAVTNQMESDSLAPASAVAETNILDSYHHLFTPPKDKPALLHLDVSKNIINKNGDELVLQIGLSSKKPKDADKSFHFLCLNPTQADKQKTKHIDTLLTAIYKKHQSNSKWTIDWSAKPLFQTKTLLPQEDTEELDDLLRRYIIGLSPYNKKHFVAVVTKHDNLSAEEQRNVADMARYLASKGSSLSVIAAGNKPDIGFLKSVSSNGNGTFTLLIDEFDFDQWLSNERLHISASPIKEINFDTTLNDQIASIAVISGTRIDRHSKSFTTRINDINQGEQRVVLYRIKTPELKNNSEIDLASVELSFFDSSTNKYYTDNKKISVKISGDKNAISDAKNTRVYRSLAILETPKTLKKVASLIKQNRPYKAMEIIQNHSTKLSDLAKTLHDKQLKYDAKILSDYEAQLYDFSGKSFQSLRAWADLTLDKGRFESDF